MRNFRIDAISALQLLQTLAKALTPEAINQVLGTGYDTFNGAQKGWARLRFTPERVG